MSRLHDHTQTHTHTHSLSLSLSLSLWVGLLSEKRVISPTQRHLPDYTQHSQETSMLPAGFEPAIRASGRPLGSAGYYYVQCRVKLPITLHVGKLKLTAHKLTNEPTNFMECCCSLEHNSSLAIHISSMLWNPTVHYHGHLFLSSARLIQRKLSQPVVSFPLGCCPPIHWSSKRFFTSVSPPCVQRSYPHKRVTCCEHVILDFVSQSLQCHSTRLGCRAV